MNDKIKILLCEDDENLGMLLREFLQAKGFNADLFSDGEKGYKEFLKGKYDLCVLDVMMPKKDGFTLAQELVFRIGAILRRVKGKKEKEITLYKLGKFTFDTQKQVLISPEKTQKLTTKESDLLSLLCAHINEILERNYALKSIWIDDNYFNARSMDVYITKLRKLLKSDPSIEIINIHGKGYKLIAPEDPDQ